MKIKILTGLIILTIHLTSNVLAGVTASSPSTSLAQVASSLSYSSSSNNNIDPSQTDNQTSGIIDVEELKKNVSLAAADAGLKVDQAALDVLANSSGSDDLSIFAEIKDNVDTDIFSDDKQPTFDKNTIVYKDADWVTLTKVSGTSSITGQSYSSSNNFFKSNGVQQGKTETYVNLAKGEISAKIFTRVTRVNDNAYVENEYFTGVAGLTSFPTVGSVVRRIKSDGTDTYDNFQDSPNSIVNDATTIAAPHSSGVTRENQMDTYNNFSGAEDSVFVTAKAISTDGSTLSGTVAIEAGSCADSCTEAQFVATVERWEASTTLVAEEWDGK